MPMRSRRKLGAVQKGGALFKKEGRCYRIFITNCQPLGHPPFIADGFVLATKRELVWLLSGLIPKCAASPRILRPIPRRKPCRKKPSMTLAGVWSCLLPKRINRKTTANAPERL